MKYSNPFISRDNHPEHPRRAKRYMQHNPPTPSLTQPRHKTSSDPPRCPPSSQETTRKTAPQHSSTAGPCDTAQTADSAYTSPSSDRKRTHLQMQTASRIAGTGCSTWRGRSCGRWTCGLIGGGRGGLAMRRSRLRWGVWCGIELGWAGERCVSYVLSL